MKSRESIPVHHIHTHLKDSFFIKYYENMEDNLESWKSVKHRDEYYIFLIIEKGTLNAEVDFHSYVMDGTSIFYIKPGQIHNVHYFKGKLAWVLAVEPSFIHRSYRQQLDHNQAEPLTLEEGTLAEKYLSLKSIIQTTKDLSSSSPLTLKKDLLNSAIGIIVTLFPFVCGFQKEIPERWKIIYADFRHLIAVHYTMIKRPSEYAEKLHISLSYLNEVVKSVSGFTVSYWIHNEIILEAKRLLYYTNLAIKEISYQLGYQDPAYLSRIFVHNTGMSPIAFRKKNHG